MDFSKMLNYEEHVDPIQNNANMPLKMFFPRGLPPPLCSEIQICLNLIEGVSILKTNTTKVVLEAQWGICPAPCALSIYSRLCMKMSSFLSVRAWAMLRTS